MSETRRATSTHPEGGNKPKTARPRPSGRARKPQAKRPKWQKLFLQELALTGNVRLACQKARVERSTVYKARWEAEGRRPADDKTTDARGLPRQYDDFAAKWDAALEEAGDRLEEEAWRRAVGGTLKPVFYQGLLCTDRKGQPMGVQEYSDTLLVLLLKAHRPDKFRERFEHTGPGGKPLAPLTVVTADELAQARAEVEQWQRQTFGSTQTEPARTSDAT